MPTTPVTPSVAPVALNGRYEMGRLIAEGGMAQVYRGRDRVLDREVAIKVLRPQYAASSEFLDRFRREARLAASVAHPNLVNVFDVGEDGAQHYIVMELLPGRTLKDLVTPGPLSLEQAVDLTLQVAKGMAYAHRRGLVHRDLKPQNVLLTDDGHAKVADFGLAQGAETAQLTTPGTVWGTVQYISPEQAQGLRPDARSDIYALGAMFYELLTGHPPYEGGSPASIMMRHVYDPPPSLRATAANLPAAAERVLARAMAKAPADRYQTMDEVAQALVDLRDTAGAETTVWSALPGTAGTRSRADGETKRRRDAGARERAVVPFGSAQAGGAAGRAGDAARPRFDGRTMVMSPAEVRGAARPAARRPARRWLPLALAGGVLAFFALMALGALLASQLISPFGASARPTSVPQPTATLAPTATPVPPTATPIPQVPIPNLIGQPLARAKDRLTEAGLQVEIAEDFSREYPAGVVAAQDPPANKPVDQGSAVKLTVSKGPQRAPIPAVIGDTVDAATDKLTKAGFMAEKQEEFSKLAATGIVFDQSPRGGTQADVGSKVSMKVSKGPDVVVVPRVIGQPEQAAVDAVTKAGLKADVVYEATTTVDPGVVFTQDPVPDARADRGSTVQLRVRRDPTPAPTATATPQPARTVTPAPATTATVAPTAAGTPPAATATTRR